MFVCQLVCCACVQNIQGMTGTPMVAASPERHDGGLQASQVEVQTYQPPWKVLSDFALQSDIDQPAFQQLVSALENEGPEGWSKSCLFRTPNSSIITLTGLLLNNNSHNK